MAPPLIHPEINRLARRIHAGEVVFFVGAGFSIDSEGLSAKRIVRRLLLRLYAFEQVFDEEKKAGLTNLFAGVFGEDFDWKRNLGIPATLKDFADPVVGRLASRYYEVNEWMIQAYVALLPRTPPAAGLSQRINDAEHKLASETGPEWANERFKPLPETYWANAAEATPQQRLGLGKLIFLDAVGFRDDALMSGCLEAVGSDSSLPDAVWSDLAPIARSFGNNFRPRHHVLARLAREGLCTTLVTTNFDLLLEGAFRLAGFCWPNQSTDLAPTAVPHFDVIDSAASFYTKGKAFRTATVVKLHGCVRRVRLLETRRRELEDYLDEIVFTYREIQNWRDDSWAADFVRTLLRTRTVVFSGYSTADPVIHDTVRSVYEEMSREQSKALAFARRSRPPHASLAPAYFLAYNSDDKDAEGRHEFHGREILRAASLAVGARPPSSGSEHPNYIRFRKPTPNAPRLPIDELLRWAHHLVFRRQQLQALQTDLRPLMKSLIGRVPADQIDRTHGEFRLRLRRELRAAHGRRTANTEADNRARRAVIRGALDWSSGFHRALLREWACGQALQRTASLTRTLHHMTHPLWYFPASERPAWTAWSAVLELALERLGALAQTLWNASHSSASRTVSAVMATQAAQPTLMIRQRDAVHSPQLALTLRMRGLDAPNTLPEVPGHPARHVVWTLPFDSLPWPGASARATHPALNLGNAHWTSPPAAHVIWALAANLDAPPPVTIFSYLGSWRS